jgi:tRNA(Ile)-lysidine synthetase-like protein
MITPLEPGKYILAVSGGVDSVSLLNLLSKQPEIDLVVAHFDHGIRDNSAEDAEFVKSLAGRYNLPFELGHGKLGANASEALARQKRYEFLEKTRDKYGAQAIITAHHQDDVLETALINVLRGTGRKGLSSLKSSNKIVRPLLNLTKQELIDHAKKQKLSWREDPSNKEERYTRNKVRKLLEKSDSKTKTSLSKVIKQSLINNEEADRLLQAISGNDSQTIDRGFFISLPYDVSTEVLAHWLRSNGREFDRKNIARLVRTMKTGAVGTKHNVDKNYILVIGKKQISLQQISSV